MGGLIRKSYKPRIFLNEYSINKSRPQKEDHIGTRYGGSIGSADASKWEVETLSDLRGKRVMYRDAKVLFAE